MSGRSHVDNPGELMSLALAAANRETPRSSIEKALWKHRLVTDLASVGGKAQADRLVQKTIDKAFLRVATHPAARDRGAILEEIAEARQGWWAHEWPGRTGPTDWRVLEGAFLVALKAKSTSFGLALRTWAMCVGLPYSQVKRSRDRLLNRGAISIVAKANQHQGTATRYKIKRPIGNSSALPGGSTCSTSGILRHDAFRTRGLGCMGLFILSRLDVDDAFPETDFAAGYSLNLRRVKESLRQLEACGLAEKRDGAWLRAIDDRDIYEALVIVAARHGILGTLAVEVGQYAHERRREALRRAQGKVPLSVADRAEIDEAEEAVRDLVRSQVGFVHEGVVA